MGRLSGRMVAILVDQGFEQVEMVGPRDALDGAEARTRLVSPERGTVRGWDHTQWGEEFPVDVTLDAASPGDFDALVLPGGVMNPDKLRMKPEAVAFVRAFFEAGKPVAVICHGAWTLIDAGVVRGRRLTSWPSLRTDLVNAGANWVDEEVVLDGDLLSSRKPDDLPAFNRVMLQLFEHSTRPAPDHPQSSSL